MYAIKLYATYANEIIFMNAAANNEDPTIISLCLFLSLSIQATKFICSHLDIKRNSLLLLQLLSTHIPASSFNQCNENNDQPSFLLELCNTWLDFQYYGIVNLIIFVWYLHRTQYEPSYDKENTCDKLFMFQPPI